MRIRSFVPRGRLSRALAAGLLSTGLLVASTTAASPPAAAVGITHKFALPLKSTGSAMEKAARLQITCNDSTGRVAIKVTNVQVFQPDGVTPWPEGTFTQPATPGRWVVAIGPGLLTRNLMLFQNTTNGLFQASDFFNMNPAACVTGATWAMSDSRSGGVNLLFQGSMT